MVGRQTPFLALIVPLILVGMVDGARGVRQTWPAAVVGGFTLRDRPVRVLELHLRRADRHRRLAGLHRLDRGFLRGLDALRAAARRGPGRRRRAPRSPAPRPTTPAHERRCASATRSTTRTREKLAAFAPYMIIIVVFALAQAVDPVEHFLSSLRRHRLRHRRERPTGSPGRASTSSTPTASRRRPRPSSSHSGPRRGHAAAVLRPAHDARAALQPRAALRTYGETLDELKWATSPSAVLGARLRDEPLRHDDHARPVDRRRGRAARRSCRRSSAGWASRSRARTRRRTRCSARCRWRRPRRPASPTSARLGQLLRRRARQDDLAAEPRDRRRRGRAGRQGGRPLPRGLFWSIVLVLIMCVIVYLQSTAVLDWMVVEEK